MTLDVAIDSELTAQLAAAGFQRSGCGVYRSGKFDLRLRNDWAVLTDQRKTRRPEPLDIDPGTAGPWRFITVGSKLARVAEFPLIAAETTTDLAFDSPREGKPAVVHFLEWAKQTAKTSTFPDWCAPPEETVGSWIDAGQLTVQVHRHVRQIVVQRTDTELALRVPIVADVPPDLADNRNRWLRTVLLETRNRWRMVRVHDARNDPQRSAIAEIVLTDAPHSILETLFTVGLQSLAYAVQWSVQSADFLTDPGVSCRAWEVRQPV